MTKDEIKKHMIIKGWNKDDKCFIEIKPKDKYTIKDLYETVNKELLLTIKNKNFFIYRGKTAKLIIWWLFFNAGLETDEKFL